MGSVNLGNVRGPQGLQGPQGPVGPVGPQGPEGPVGPQGPQGLQGLQGPQGPKGDTGATGPQGPQGPKGDTGATGPQGPQGLKGDTGATGLTGATGPAGAPSDVTRASSSVVAIGTGAKTFSFTAASNLGWAVGSRIRAAAASAPTSYVEGVVTALSSTSVTLSSDVTGGSGSYSSWNLSLAGARGATGPQGPKGDKGDTGSTGPQGIQGIQGPQGERGPAGTIGYSLVWSGSSYLVDLTTLGLGSQALLFVGGIAIPYIQGVSSTAGAGTQINNDSGDWSVLPRGYVTISSGGTLTRYTSSAFQFGGTSGTQTAQALTTAIHRIL